METDVETLTTSFVHSRRTVEYLCEAMEYSKCHYVVIYCERHDCHVKISETQNKVIHADYMPPHIESIRIYCIHVWTADPILPSVYAMQTDHSDTPRI